MSISVNHEKAKNILFEQDTAAREGAMTPLANTWRDRVAKLSDLCPHGKSSTVIAALGTALLAKATDSRVDVYSLLDRGEAKDSYSARSLADNVWARHRAELAIDLGANGTNPLNNTPFIGKTRIDEISGVRNKAGWAYFLECMAAAKGLSSSKESCEALRGFIVARRRSILSPIEIHPELGDSIPQSQLIQAINGFVADDSEGGRRAQAAVAAMLDVAFAPSLVVVGVINDPDRHAPLDVSVINAEGMFEMAFEVKDKPILDYHVRGSIEKTVKDHSVRNLAFVAISKNQSKSEFDSVIQWAAAYGVKATIFTDWESLYLACKCFASYCEQVYEGEVFRRTLVRCGELGVSRDGENCLRSLAGLPNV